jgi:hypothetical protein
LVGCAATTLCAQEFPVVIDKLEIERAVQAAMAAKDEALAHKDEVLAALKSGELFAKHTAAMDKALFAAHGMNFQFGRAGNTPLTDDEEMKIMAIDSLMQSDAERAIPVVDKIIQNQQASTRLRLRALQSMSRSNSPKAREVVIRVAKDGSNPEMQSRAIRMLGSRESTQNRQLLSEIYASSTTSRSRIRLSTAWVTLTTGKSCWTSLRRKRTKIFVIAQSNGLAPAGRRSAGSNGRHVQLGPGHVNPQCDLARPLAAA